MIVISNGMLRSGSTVQYNIAADVLESSSPQKREGFLGGFDKPEVRAKLEKLKGMEDWFIVKTHEPPLEFSFYDERVRVLFSYRDVRDIAASIRKKWGYPFEKILSDIEDMIEVERAFMKIPNVLVQPYDMLYRELPRATREIAAFLGATLSEQKIRTIANENSVENSKRRVEKRLRNPAVWALSGVFGRFRIDPKTQMHDNHISASGGGHGDWVKRFTIEEINELDRR